MRRHRPMREKGFLCYIFFLAPSFLRINILCSIRSILPLFKLLLLFLSHCPRLLLEARHRAEIINHRIVLSYSDLNLSLSLVSCLKEFTEQEIYTESTEIQASVLFLRKILLRSICWLFQITHHAEKLLALDPFRSYDHLRKIRCWPARDDCIGKCNWLFYRDGLSIQRVRHVRQT